ncbi:hypothetical protein [Microbacterium sp. MPKO10]|uniref:hypothetical protein n=1 Tax=Microbacterium sp. MPKO10 TaxID=2989818 RepID=UPI0022363473|nr:hypothetical protein [Microbacterium sp. MPKO10]MCW4459679.1 hypothetical protein [Microbacterium sp. MPKO10]
MMHSSTIWVGFLLYILVAVLACFILYWIIRLGVRHGIRDARKYTKPPIPGGNTGGF